MTYPVKLKEVSDLAQTFCDSTKGKSYPLDVVVFACYFLAATALQQRKDVKFSRDECFNKLVATTRTFIVKEDSDGDKD